MKPILSLGLPAVLMIGLSGCATGINGSPRRICYDAGYQPKTQAFTDCWHKVRDQQFAGDLVPFLIGANAVMPAGRSAPPTPTIDLEKSPPKPAPVIKLTTDSDPLRLKPERECIYYTSKGKRVMRPVNGICPAHYGE
jgi:hypothetical protein